MIQITFDEEKLTAIVRQAIKDERELQQTLNTAPVHDEHRYLYSIQELADFLHCSIVTAQRMKNDGLFPYKQTGRKVIIDTVEIMKALDVPYNRKKKSKL